MLDPWGSNRYTNSMFKKYWWIMCLIIVGYVLMAFTANSSI